MQPGATAAPPLLLLLPPPLLPPSLLLSRLRFFTDMTAHKKNGTINLARGHLPGRRTKGAKVHRRALASTSM